MTLIHVDGRHGHRYHVKRVYLAAADFVSVVVHDIRKPGQSAGLPASLVRRLRAPRDEIDAMAQRVRLAEEAELEPLGVAYQSDYAMASYWLHHGKRVSEPQS